MLKKIKEMMKKDRESFTKRGIKKYTYSKETKEAVVKYVKREIAKGITMTTVIHKLGITQGTYNAWVGRKVKSRAKSKKTIMKGKGLSVPAENTNLSKKGLKQYTFETNDFEVSANSSVEVLELLSSRIRKNY